MPQPRHYEDQAQRQRAYRQRAATARQAQLQACSLPPLPALPTMPGDRRWRQLSLLAQWALQTAHDEMHTYHEERSSDWQDSERGEAFTDRIALLEQALDQVADLS